MPGTHTVDQCGGDLLEGEQWEGLGGDPAVGGGQEGGQLVQGGRGGRVEHHRVITVWVGGMGVFILFILFLYFSVQVLLLS